MRLIKTSLCIISAVYYLLSTAVVYAVDEIGIQIGSIKFEQANTKDINVEFGLASSGLTMSLSTPVIDLAKPIGRLNKLKLTCQKLSFFSEHVQCLKGVVNFQHQQLGNQRIFFAVTAQPNAEYYQLNLSNIKLADAKFVANLKLHKQSWQITSHTPEASLSALISAISPYITSQQIEQLAQWDLGGMLEISIKAKGTADGFDDATVDIGLHDLAVSEVSGRYVAETVAATFTTKLNQKLQRINWDSQLAINKGQVYAEPIFIDFNETAASVVSQGVFNQQTDTLLVEKFEFKHADILTSSVSYRGKLDFSGELELKLDKTDFKGLFQHWLQPFLFDAGLAELDIVGDISATLNKRQDNVSLYATLYDVHIDDQQNRFGMYELNGDLAWTNGNQFVNSSLAWQGGYLYQLPLGASSLQAQVQQQRFQLTDKLHLPLLDGAVDIEHFELFIPQQGELEWVFKAELNPISMTDLTSSFGWPTMNGKLSGSIPKVSYSNHQIDIDGALQVNLFEGTTVIKDLRLSEPFGSLPQLYANIELKNINLETLTSTFDFGKITGKLEGHITNLRLANWQPVAFDAAFYTPQNDESRHRISQQAVNNLSEVSGGASGLLSRSFLGFFENFSYKQLGLSCKLVNDVCEMDGVKPAENGYYLVEGGGMPPQINVMGYTRRVNWPDLLARLKAVSNAEGVVVE